MYDVAVIGTGPAGISAALTLKLHNKNIVWFGSAGLSDKVEKSEKIANYPGLGMIGGAELNQKMRDQAAQLELSITDKTVTNITKTKSCFMILAENDLFEAKSVLLCTGVASAKGISGEQELLGRGVSYCATCDGFLYKNKTIAVICALPRYEHEVEYLAELADTVYLSVPYKNCGIHLPNVKPIGRIAAIRGEDRVCGITVGDEEIAVDGVFVLRSAIAPSLLMPELEISGAHMVVDRSCKTNVDGCFAAGDCTGRPYQIAKAVGEGNVAAHSILQYLSENERSGQ